jgi:tyrosine-protein phosphatase YwqE
MDDAYRAAADEVRARGFAVLVAHPERAMVGPSASAVLDHELAAGSGLQLNAWSVAGLYGERLRALALRLSHSARHVVVASDAHGRERMPSLQMALGALPAGGERDGERLVAAAPRALLEHGLAVPPTALVA